MKEVRVRKLETLTGIKKHFYYISTPFLWNFFRSDLIDQNLRCEFVRGQMKHTCCLSLLTTGAY